MTLLKSIDKNMEINKGPHLDHHAYYGEVPNRQAVSFFPITSAYTPNYSQLLISNPLMTSYPATSTKGSDGKLYSIQRIDGVNSALWIRRWDHMVELSHMINPQVLNYIACHLETGVGTSTAYLVTEYTAHTLRDAKDKLNLSPADVIRAMFQVSEALINLKKRGYSHHSINPDSIFIIENQDRTYSYKLGNLGAWMKTNEVDYDKRPEYRHLLPSDFKPSTDQSYGLSNNSDVYSLGITIMEIIGVNVDTLMTHKTKEVDPNYHHDVFSIAGVLRKLLLEAVHPDPEKRLSLESLRDQLCTIIANIKDGDLDYYTLCAGLEAVPLVPYSKLPGINAANHKPLISNNPQKLRWKFLMLIKKPRRKK